MGIELVPLVTSSEMARPEAGLNPKPWAEAVATMNPAGDSSRSMIGIIGEAGAATPEKGVKLLEAIATAVANALLEERLWEEPI